MLEIIDGISKESVGVLKIPPMSPMDDLVIGELSEEHKCEENKPRICPEDDNAGLLFMRDTYKVPKGEPHSLHSKVNPDLIWVLDAFSDEDDTKAFIAEELTKKVVYPDSVVWNPVLVDQQNTSQCILLARLSKPILGISPKDEPERSRGAYREVDDLFFFS